MMNEKPTRRQFLAGGLAAIVGFAGGEYLARGREAFAAESKTEKEQMKKNLSEYNRLESIVDGYCMENNCIYEVFKENEKKRDAIRGEILKHPAFSDYHKEKKRLENKKEEPTKSFGELYELLKKSAPFNGLPSSTTEAVNLERKFLDSYSHIWSEENLQKRAARIEVALTEYKKVEKSFNTIYTKFKIEVDKCFGIFRKVFREVPLKDKRLEAIRNVSDTLVDEVGKDKDENKQLLDYFANLDDVKRKIVINSCGLDYLLERTIDEMVREKEKELVR